MVRPRPTATIGGDGRILTGTAAAVAAGLAVDPVVVRLGFVVLAVAGGWGIVAYLVCWATFATAVTPPVRSAEVGDPLRDLGVGLIVIGVVVQARLWGSWFNDALVWPVCVAAVAIGVAWRRFGSIEVASLVDSSESDARSTSLRVIAGGILAVGGAASLIGVHLSFGAWLRTVVGFVAALVGVAVIFGPTLAVLTNALVAERRERIRADERAVISSHLHDSVLQTLTLIQKRSGDPGQVQSLARRQERELRQWLYGDRDARVGTVRGAFEDAAAEVEDRERVSVECVVVGDRELDEQSEAVVLAAREALVNGAKFSGQTRLSLYAEVGPDSLQAFVRDRGVGFDPTAVAADRRGIAESIVGRMQRVGGAAVVRSAPGEGTEVSLVVPDGEGS
jgi:signal transduction histidine kinase